MKIKPDKMKMFLAMRDVFYGGEFSHWLNQQELPVAALKEYEEAYEFFCEETGFVEPTDEKENGKTTHS